MRSALLSQCLQLLKRHSSSTTSSIKHSNISTKHFEEVRISVPWGHLAGKWYGPRHVRPIVGLHGWQDNAGTFDTLAPLLAPHVSFLCLDLPGHGLSSWLPEGIAYHSIDYVLLLNRLMEEHNWDKISIMGHSMSSINGFVFCSLYPQKVDLFIGLDVLKPLIKDPVQMVNGMAERLVNFLRIEKRARGDSEPPAYEWDQLVERLYNGTHHSVDMEMCKYLLQRNVKPSRHEPNKYFFSRDSRLKSSIPYSLSREVVAEMARRVTCPHLFIKALSGPYYEPKEYYDEALAIVRQHPKFEYHEVEGTHHVHLNEPDKIADVVNEFINKHRT